MNRFRTMVAGTLLLFGAAACADLEVTNPNNPGRDAALTSAGDVQSLIVGAFPQWVLAEQWDGSQTAAASFILSTQAFQWTSTAANFGMLQYTRFPRSEIRNTVTHRDFPVIEYSWNQNYRALSAVATGLQALEANEEWAADLGAQGMLQLRIFGKFMQGLSHASVAVLYDRGFVIDETVQVLDESGAPANLGEPVEYPQLMARALSYFDQAIALAQSPAATGITFPADWLFATGSSVTMPELVRLANSLQARYRASVARNPQERAAVNWAAVIADAQQGVTTDWNLNQEPVYAELDAYFLYYPTYAVFAQLPYFIHGMADVSGDYQKWLAQPLGQRYPTIPYPTGSQVLIRTPDKRYPQGNTGPAQAAAPGLYYSYVTNNAHNRPERGEWRWSWYRTRGAFMGLAWATEWPIIRRDELRLLIAEGLFRAGQLQAAADSVNVTRVGVGGLNATNAAGLNTSCVPRLPNGSCGNLFEMLKWEKRQETFFTGPYYTTWYFDGRGWGDLYKGTPQQWPMPAAEAGVLGLPINTYGGSGAFSSPGSTYQWPGE